MTQDIQSSRRALFAGALALGRGALGRGALGGAALGGGAAAAEARAKDVTVDPRTALHQEVAYPVAPARIYQTLLSSEAFAAFSGLPAKIDPRVGGAFQMFAGQIEGVTVELAPDRRIVQAWRPIGDFAPGVYTLVRFELAKAGSEATVVLDQTGIPPGHYGHLFSGWYEHYWTPLRKVLI